MAVSEDIPRLLVVLGPTASGKTSLSLQLARDAGGEILSFDSMQVYRGMNIGTAKPTAQEMACVKHHGIDLIEPTETFTVGRFVAFADHVITDAASRGVPLIATGGTPLYYKSVFEGLFEGPAADEQVRARLRQASNDELHDRLRQVDPEAAGRIHVQDTKRLVRALEVYELTGRPISSFQTAWSTRAVRHRAVWVGLSWDKDALNRRINARVKAMIDAGWVQETRALLDHYGSLSGTAGEATGYAQLADYLAGRQSLDDAVEQIKIATRQLARRQMKWFRRFPDVHWLAGDQPLDALIGAVRHRWPDLSDGSNFH